MTGAPKISALDHIAALEPVGRGASMGAIGRVYPNGDLDLALTIRTFAVAEGRIHLWVGGGIVWDSEPEAEIEESLVKARPLLAAIGAPLPERGARGDAAGGRRRRARRRRRRTSPCCSPTTRRSSAAARRSRRCGSTAGRRSGSTSTWRGCAASAERLGIGWPGGVRGARRARRSRRRGEPDAVLRLYLTPGREGSGRPVALALVSSLPADLEERRARGIALISLLGVRAEAPWLLGGVKSTSYAVNMAAEARGAGARRRRRGVRPRRRRRARGAGDERLVAARRDALHAVARPRDPRGRDAGGADRGGPGAATRSRGCVTRWTTLLGAEEVVHSSSVREVMPVVAARRARVRARPGGGGAPGGARGSGGGVKRLCSG